MVQHFKHGHSIKQKKLQGDISEPDLVDYCSQVLADKNPFANMRNKDDESRRMCELTMPAIRENYYKFDRFYHERFTRTSKKYTAQNFNEICKDEDISGFVCGSDTVFCTDEFGIDDGYYANYECMKKCSVAYTASFGDPHFKDEIYKVLNDRLQNFNAFGLREKLMVPYVTKHTNVPVKKAVDPTFLLMSSDYDKISKERLEQGKYLLLYARRYNPKWKRMQKELRQNMARRLSKSACAQQMQKSLIIGCSMKLELRNFCRL